MDETVNKKVLAPTLVVFVSWILITMGFLNLCLRISYLIGSEYADDYFFRSTLRSAFQLILGVFLLRGARWAYYLFVVFLGLSLVNDLGQFLQSDAIGFGGVDTLIFTVFPLGFFIFWNRVRCFFFRTSSLNHINPGDSGNIKDNQAIDN